MSERYKVSRTSASNSGLRYYLTDTTSGDPVREDDVNEYVIRYKTMQDAQKTLTI